MSAKWLTRIGLALGALSVLGVLAYLLWPKPIAVDAATIDVGELRVTIDEEGKTRVKETFVVAAPIAGRVLRSRLAVGDYVTAGTSEVAVLLPAAPPLLDVRTRASIEAQVGAAEAAVKLAESALAEAQSAASMADADLKRTSQLSKKGFAAESALDRAVTTARARTAAVASAKSAVDVRKAELRTARAGLIASAPQGDTPKSAEPVRLRAPHSGKILRLPVESETVVAAGTPLVEIGDPAELEIVADVLSADAVRVVPGAEVSVEDWGGATPLKAVVRRIEPAGFTKVSALGIEEQRVRTVIDMTDPPEKFRMLGHAYRVFVRILAWRSATSRRVPMGALFRDGEEWAVFKLVAGKARLQHVQLGHRNSAYAEILQGLSAGEQVVLHPSDRVSDGVSVEIRP